jgi:hypothetical protein
MNAHVWPDIGPNRPTKEGSSGGSYAEGKISSVFVVLIYARQITVEAT